MSQKSFKILRPVLNYRANYVIHKTSFFQIAYQTDKLIDLDDPLTKYCFMDDYSVTASVDAVCSHSCLPFNEVIKRK